MIPLITLEEHFFTSSISDWSGYGYGEQLKHLPGVLEKLHDLSTIRLKSMDDNGINIQIISHAPGLGLASPEDCKKANDNLSAAVKAHPDRFAGFAVLPMHDPEAAAEELRRCIQDLGFVGALVDNHVKGQHYEGKAYHPFWKMVQDLDTQVYLHPTWPAEDIQKPQTLGEISPGATASLGSSGWGWHSDVGLHVLKLFASGLFDTFPKLKIIIGHMGEMIPFMLERIEYLSKRWGPLKRLFGQVYAENIWITTSGCWSVNPMACILRNTPIDHILYSVDYPFAKNEDGLAFMQDLEKSGLVTKEQFEMIGWGNAEKLLGVKVKK